MRIFIVIFPLLIMMIGCPPYDSPWVSPEPSPTPTLPPLNILAEKTSFSGSDNLSGDHFGTAVSISGNYAIVGADSVEWKPSSYSMGAAYIYERDGAGNWAHETILHASDGVDFDQFGLSVSISGNYAIVGAPYRMYMSTAYIFERNGSGVWQEKKIMHASDEQANDNFGYSVAISGNYAIIGAPEEDGGIGNPLNGSGAIYIFERDGSGNWIEKSIHHASDGQANDNFGYSVAISGNYAIIGAPKEDGGTGNPLSGSGAIYIFERDGSGNWIEKSIHHASDGQANDNFGYSVAISGTCTIVGAPYEDGGTGDPLNGSGAIYIFGRDGSGNWIEKTIIHHTDPRTNNMFGWRVSITNNFAISSIYNSSTIGNVSLLEKDEFGNWNSLDIIQSQSAVAGDGFGLGISIDVSYVIIGSPFKNVSGVAKGRCYIFE